MNPSPGTFLRLLGVGLYHTPGEGVFGVDKMSLFAEFVADLRKIDARAKQIDDLREATLTALANQGAIIAAIGAILLEKGIFTEREFDSKLSQATSQLDQEIAKAKESHAH